MCGIFGLFNVDEEPVNLSAVHRATTRLRHRGPDDEGYLLVNTRRGLREERRGDDTVAMRSLPHIQAGLDATFDLAFGFRRLSIIDLSPAGHQPMCSEDGTMWVMFNGEIYNYRILREELTAKGHKFRSNTDTEVIVHAYEEWGPDCLNRFNGMWAFAIWDGRQKKLFCARDRFGIKPFYYFQHNRTFAFASEIKALLELDVLPREANHEVIYDYLAQNLVDHTENTFFSNIKKLMGGHYLEWRVGDRTPSIHRYYDLPRNGVSTGDRGAFEKRFYELFQDSIRLRLMSDVPLGSCLSGGLDSSSIVCMVDKLMREEGLKLPGGETIQKTFSARYDEKRHDEGPFIDAVVKQTCVDAHFIYPIGHDLAECLEDLIYYQEEPFSSTSIYAQWKVFELTKQCGVKVALDGQGADEVFAGYHFYFGPLFADLLRTLQGIAFVRELSAQLSLRCQAVGHDLRIAAGYICPEVMKVPLRRSRALARSLKEARVGGFLNEEFVARFAHQSALEEGAKRGNGSFLDGVLYEGLVFSALPSYLRYEDKNSMAHSIESRLPFLDYRLVEFAFSLPWDQKIQGGTTKAILRNALKGILPDVIRQRQDKVGFSTPDDVWLRGEMKDTISQIINSDLFLGRPFFHADSVKAMVRDNQSGQINISTTIWQWAILELWMRKFIDGTM
jgi:asparagine synthase (glutamine-hydrolysing)